MNAFSRNSSSAHLPALKHMSPNQHLLVYAMRKWHMGSAEMPDVAQTLFRIFGIYHVEAAIQAFETVLSAMIDNPHNHLAIASLHQSALSAGEMTFLQLITSFHAGAPKTARRLARQIAGRDMENEVFCAACQIAQSLDARRIVFTLRDYQPLALMPIAGHA